MARDPPTPSPTLLDASPHLRDLDLKPSTIKSADPVIIHPQLRDLILPLERGRVLYPRGGAIEELSWVARDAEDSEEMELDVAEESKTPASARTLVKLSFTPNCLVANKTILAAGGQHGELYITNAPTRNGQNASAVENKLAARFPVKPLRPFNINLSLQSRSINNSMVLLPTYPAEWGLQADQRRIGFIASQSRSAELEGEEGEMEDASMDLDEDETEDQDEEEEDEPRSPLTYPNTVPFQHAPRIPHLPSHQGSSWVSENAEAGPSRRTASFSDHHRTRGREIRPTPTRLERQSFSIPRPGTGMPPIQYVTSRPMAVPPSPRSSHSSSRGGHKNNLQRHNAVKGHNPRIEGVVDEPRLLISNNDLTVKMFSLRSVPPRPATGAGAAQEHDTYRPLGRLQPPSGQVEQTFDDWSRSDQGFTASRLARERLQRQLSEFQRIVGMQVSRPTTLGNPRIVSPSPPTPPQPPVEQKDKEERKLVRIGGSKFKCAINHSSLSPDLKNMVSVGDSEEVYLFEVVDGGREFRKVATYKAATDSGFSTAWSSDGRKFAVASQDGQVTIWDHRSSKPLAKFFSTRGSGSHHTYRQPSFSTDLLSHLSRDRTGARGSPPILLDPVTGDARVGSSSSGREAARVVKFSPAGSPRDLLVFSEENSNIHIIDAQTLNTHVVLPVPASPNDAEVRRTGHEGGTWGIAGIAFDPTGQWLYSGTERTVVEWDMRGGTQSQGVWDMA